MNGMVEAVEAARYRRRQLLRAKRQHLRNGTRLLKMGCPAVLTSHVACRCHPISSRERGRHAHCGKSVGKLRFVLLGRCSDHLTWWDRLWMPERDRYCRFVSPEVIVPAAEYGVEPDCGAHLDLLRWLRCGRCEEHEGKASLDG